MTNDLSPTPVVAHSGTARRPVSVTIARALAIVSLVISVVLLVPYVSVSLVVAAPAFVLAFAAAIAGLVLAGRAMRDSPVPRRAATWALLTAIVALVIDAVLVIVFLAGLAAFRLDNVELRGQGPDDISATFSNDLETRTVVWPSVGRAEFNTKGSWAEITITAPPGSVTTTVSCQIVWNDEIVVDKTSDSGTVDCRYDEG